MAKYLITRKRMVTQEVTFEIEPEAGVAPIAAGNAVDPDTLGWTDVLVTDLSSDVAPVQEEDASPHDSDFTSEEQYS